MKKIVFWMVFLGMSPLANAQSNMVKTDTLFALEVEEDLMNLAKEDKFNLMNLSNVDVMTASQKSEKSGKAPATILVITEEQIRLRGYQSLADVLEDMPDFKVERYTNSQIGNIMTVRGIRGQENFIILLDGVKISSPTDEPMPIMENYPVYLAKQIEVVYGPASALYGANAVAGVVNIITKKSTKSGVHGEVLSNYGRFGTTNTQIFVESALKGKGHLTAGGQYFYDALPDLSKYYSSDTLFDMSSHRTGLFKTLFGPVQVDPKTITPKFEAPNMAYNLYANFRNKGFSLGVFHNYARVPSAMNNTPNNAVYNKDVFYAQRITMGNLVFAQELGKISTVSRVVGSIYETDPQSNFRNVYVGMKHGYKYAYGNMLKAEQQVIWDISEKINIVAGATHEAFSSIPKGFDLEKPMDKKTNLQGVISGSRTPLRPEGIAAPIVNVLYTNTGGYLQMQIAPSPIFSATIGARYDYNSRFGGAFNPRLGLVITPSSKTSFKALYGSAFFAPSPFVSFEQFGSFVSFDQGASYKSFFLQLANPDLAPVKSNAFELGFKQFISENLSFTTNAYYMTLDNLVTYVPDATNGNRYKGKYLGYPVDFVQIKINLGTQRNYGAHLQIDYLQKLDKGYLNSFVGVSYADGTIEIPFYESGKRILKETDIPFISELYTRVGLDFRYGRFFGSTRWHILSSQRTGVLNEDKKTRFKISGYTLGNLTLGYELTKQLSVYGMVRNILDARYRSLNEMNANDDYAFRGMPQVPIRFTGGLRMNW
ncbi:MAG: TonB-dependent receptor [Flammeovirgaceae bacterium]|nr:TonB-dependent receptor [Flammeovirgaceae bacterium]MDW8287232.1 TonB-dependent receptor [Flammeovirgaceae bacterium]